MFLVGLGFELSALLLETQLQSIFAILKMEL
jgi:hypothetical protein